MLLSDNEIEYFYNNKDQITSELLEVLRNNGKPGKMQALKILDLPRDSDDYYLDAYNNRVSYMGSRNLKKAFTKLKLSKIHIEEISKCINDIHYFLKNYVRMTTPKGFDFVDSRPYQDDYLDKLSDESIEKIIVLMPRQSGKSVSTAIKLAHSTTFDKDLTIGVVANRGDQAREFLDKTKKIIQGLPVWIQPSIITWNKGSIECENNVRILTDVPTQDAFRGYSCNYIIVDEAAFITQGFQDLKDSVFPTQAGLSRKKLILLSTSNGKNHFYDIWQDAGESIEESKNNFIRYFVNWEEVPRFKSDGTFYEPSEFKEDQIKANGLVYFNQNYGCSFIGSAETLIQGEILNKFKIKEPIDIDKIADSIINIYEEPIEGHRYILSVDTSKNGVDPSAFQIFDISDLHFRQVVASQLYINHMELPELLVEYGNKFNQALIVVENNEGSGQSVADHIKWTFEYENLYHDIDKKRRRLKYPGCRTTKLSRLMMLSACQKFAEAGLLTLCDEKTIKEFETFTLSKSGKYQAQLGFHDDLVMAVCLAFSIFSTGKNFEDYKKVLDTIKVGESKSNGEFLTFGAFADGL